MSLKEPLESEIQTLTHFYEQYRACCASAGPSDQASDKDTLAVARAAYELGEALIDLREQTGEAVLETVLASRTSIPWAAAQRSMNFVLHSDYGRQIESTLDQVREWMD